VANNNKHPRPTPARADAKPVEEVSRVQRILSVVGPSILGLGIIALFALLLGESLTPVAISEDLGIWAIVAFVPDIAIPVGFLIIIVLLIITFRRRAQAAKVASK
jgi:hypothetical protein